MRIAAVVIVPILFLTAAAAQDDVLAVERKEDLAAHAKVVRKLKKLRIPLVAVDMSAQDLCRLLSAVTANEPGFLCSRRESDAAPKLNVEMSSASLWSIMSVAQMETGMRFVYRYGMVFCDRAEDVKPLTFLQVYNLRGAVMPLRSFPGPDLRLRTAGDERPLFPEEVETESTVSGFTAEGIETLLRENVRPDTWDSERVSLVNQDGLFLIRQTPQAHRDIAILLSRIGLISAPRVITARPQRLAARSTLPSPRTIRLPPVIKRRSFGW